MNVTYFGDLDPAALQDSYDAQVTLGGRPIKLELNFDPLALTEDKAIAINAFLADLPSHVDKAKAFINIKNESVKDFIDFHVEELPPATIAPLLDPNLKLSKAQQLVAKLVVERIGIYPNAKGDGFAIFDHTFDGNTMENGRRAFTDQIIAVYLDSNGKIGHLSHES